MANNINKKNEDTSTLVLESSLQWFFFDQLQQLNKKSVHPISNEALYYSSLVLDRMGGSGNFFENEEGKLKDKILGIKLLQSTKMPKEKQKRCLQDVGDTALMVCGYFSDSLNKKIIDFKYYQDLGRTAYSRLDSFVPQAYEMNSFFKHLSKSFHNVTMMINLVAQQTMENARSGDEAFLILSDSPKAS